jgi:hypothetical protein
MAYSNSKYEAVRDRGVDRTITSKSANFKCDGGSEGNAKREKW